MQETKRGQCASQVSPFGYSDADPRGSNERPLPRTWALVAGRQLEIATYRVVGRIPPP